MGETLCPHCGDRLPKVADAFCSSCGNRLDELPAPPASARSTPPAEAPSEPMQCPRCALLHPPTAQRCECGYEFVLHQLAPLDPALEPEYLFAAQQMHQGAPWATIEQRLLERGLSPDTAALVLARLKHDQNQALQADGQKNMLFGAMWCGGGLLITTWTYLGASESGGIYVLAWGPVLYGAIRFFRGLTQTMGQ